jgi:hypothetical protein
MIITNKDLGKTFNNGSFEGVLQSMFKYYPTDDISYVRLSHGNKTDSLIQEDTFLKNYKLGKLHPPKGTICECTYHNNKTFLKYSNGDGTYSSAKDGQERSFNHHFISIKQINNGSIHDTGNDDLFCPSFMGLWQNT